MSFRFLIEKRENQLLIRASLIHIFQDYMRVLCEASCYELCAKSYDYRSYLKASNYLILLPAKKNSLLLRVPYNIQYPNKIWLHLDS
jgi:hypothetical protein